MGDSALTAAIRIHGAAAVYAALDAEQRKRLPYNWRMLARPEQLAPAGEWRRWLVMAGRSWGKTRTASEFIRGEVEGGRARRIALVGRSAADVRDVMIEGNSGLLRIAPNNWRPIYEPSKRRLTWPNGTIATAYTAENPEELRGPEHDLAWCLAGDTAIRMADGSNRRLHNVLVGDMVATRVGPRRVTASRLTRKSAPVRRLSFANGRSIVGTAEHRVWMAGPGFTPLGSFKVGRLGQAVSGSTVAAVLLEPLPATMDVYDITVDGAHEYYANGILVHNCDEVGAWRQQIRRENRRAGMSRAEEAWSNLDFGLRIGRCPRVVVTTTPRSTKLMRKLAKPGRNVRITRGATKENVANLAPDVVAELEKEYAGTRLGRQELDGELLDDVEGALWTYEMIHRDRIDHSQVPTEGFDEIVVAVDPATTEDGDGAEAGIVVVGRNGDHFYVLADDSLAASPNAWGRVVINDVHAFAAAGAVVEGNAGRALLTALIRNIEKSDSLMGIARAPVPIRLVNARHSKQVRAEPIVSLYEQRRVHHVTQELKAGIYTTGFEKLEEQLTTWVPGNKSPDRLDALVHGLQALVTRGSMSTGDVQYIAPPPAIPDVIHAPFDDRDAVRAAAERMRRQLKGLM